MKKITIAAVLSLLFSGCAAGNRYAAAPLLQRDTAGTSIEGRNIKVQILGHGDEVIFVMAGIHGNEADGIPLVAKLSEYLRQNPRLLKGRKVVLLPKVNPDGVNYNIRFNANGVDLNRNFAADNRISEDEYGLAALSEPESRIIEGIIKQYRPKRVISLHQPAAAGYGWIDFDGPCEDIAERVSRLSGLPLRKLGTYPGSLGSYVGNTLNTPIITFEQPHNTERLNPRQLWQRYGKALVAAVVFPDEVR